MFRLTSMIMRPSFEPSAVTSKNTRGFAIFFSKNNFQISIYGKYFNLVEIDVEYGRTGVQEGGE